MNIFKSISLFLFVMIIYPGGICSASENLTIQNGWLVYNGKVVWGYAQHNGWWRAGQRANITRNAGDDVRPNRTEDLNLLTDNMLKYAYPGFEHNFGLWYDRRRDAHDTNCRDNPNAKGPFLEQPWARSGTGAACDGLSKYDLTKYNSWYFDRLKTFADLCDKKGTILLHNFYMQHNLLEADTHYVDFPWRTMNCIQPTGLPDHIPAANVFYDTSNAERRKLHQAYIRKCLDELGDYSNVLYLVSEEYTGSLSFMKFWLDEIEKWESKEGKKVLVCASATKDVLDAVAGDPRVSALDLRYFWYKPDGSVFAPPGGQEVAGRYISGSDAAKTNPYQIYRQVKEYRLRYPNKVIIHSIKASRQQSWAFLMGGGSLLIRRMEYAGSIDPPDYGEPEESGIIQHTYNFINDELSDCLQCMTPQDLVNNPQNNWCLAENGRTYLVYALNGGQIDLDLSNASGTFQAKWFNPRTGSLTDCGTISGGAEANFTTPDTEDWTLLVTKDSPKVGKWLRHEVILENATYDTNPFELEVDATFTHSKTGQQLVLPGYYDGNNQWKIGFMPTQLGKWTYATSSSDADLNNKTGSINCVPSGLPGLLKADPNHPKKWKYADGPYAVPIILRGKFIQEEADTSVVTQVADFMAENHIAMWNFSCTDQDGYGGRHDYFFSGDWEKHQFDLPIWQRLNERLDILAKQGLGVHIFLYDDDAGVPGWPAQSATERMVICWVVARTCGYPVVLYNTGIDIPEYRNGKDIDWIGQQYAEFDPYKHPRSSRGDKPNSDHSMANRTYDSWWAPQQSYIDPMIAYWNIIQYPGTNDDCYGENRSTHHEKDHTAEDIRRAFWKSLIAGGQGGQIRGEGDGAFPFSGFYSLHNVQSDLESEQWLKYIHTFIEDYLGETFGEMVPIASLADNNNKQYAIANDSKTKILYWKTSSTDKYDPDDHDKMEVKLSGISDSHGYNTMWFDPRSGTTINAEPLSGGKDFSLSPPNQQTDDWVLLLTAR